MAKKTVDMRHERMPLFTQFIMETSAHCNRRCAFCPQSTHPHEREFMPWDLFAHIVDELVSLNYRGRITLAGYNEATLDDRLPDVITYIRLNLPGAWILFNTNGDTLKGPSDIEQYFDAGLNGMQINIYSAADGSGDAQKIARGIEKAKARHARVQSWVDSLTYLEQDKGIYQHLGVRRQLCQVQKKWDLQPEGAADHSTTLTARRHQSSLRNHISNRAGQIPSFVGPVSSPLQKTCGRIFREMLLDWRGDSYLCCNDYFRIASVGNVRERSLLDMWNDTRYVTYRVKLGAKDRRIFLCDKCDYNGGFYTHLLPRVTIGVERDYDILSADMRTPEAAGFVPLSRLGRKS